MSKTPRQKLQMEILRDAVLHIQGSQQSEVNVDGEVLAELLKHDTGIEVKVFEVRDSMTFIPAMAIRGRAGFMDNEENRYLIRRAGWGEDQDFTLLMRFHDMECQYDPFKWKGDTRTMPEAHKYIIEHWDELPTGAVVDVEFILGEKPTIKESERVSVFPTL